VLTGVAGTVGGGGRGRFHENLSFGTFIEQLVCQKKFANEGKFFNFQSVGNEKKGEEKRLNGKEMKEKEGKMRKWEGWEEGTES